MLTSITFIRAQVVAIFCSAWVHLQWAKRRSITGAEVIASAVCSWLMSVCACHLCLFPLCWLLSLRNLEISASPSVMCQRPGNSPSASWRQRTWRKWTPAAYLVQEKNTMNNPLNEDTMFIRLCLWLWLSVNPDHVVTSDIEPFLFLVSWIT